MAVFFRTDRRADPEDVSVVGLDAEGRAITYQDSNIQFEREGTRFAVPLENARTVERVTVSIAGEFAADSRRATTRVR